MKTIKNLQDHYVMYAMHVRPTTKKQTIYCSTKFVRELGHSLDDPIDEVLTKQNLLRFQRESIEGAANCEEQNRKAISANSFVRMTRCLISKRMQDTFDEPLPSQVYEFLNARMLPQRMASYSYDERKDAMRRLIDKMQTIKAEDPVLWTAYWLTMHCGLRRREAAFARWSWVSDKYLIVRPETDFVTKSGKSRKIPINQDDRAFVLSHRADRTHILPGAYTNRYRTIFDKLAKLIRECGIKGTKSVHELRKYFGARVATDLSIFKAQRYLGHHSPELTNRLYADIIDDEDDEIVIR